MTFKKFKVKKSNTKNTKIINIIWIISVIIVFFIAYYTLQSIKDINLSIDTNNLDLNDNSKTNIKTGEDSREEIDNKESKNSTNILLVWRWWWDHDAPDLTDTIILAKINKDKKVVSLLSIPRDLYVEYPNWVNEESKINSIYIYFKNKYQSTKLWMKALETKIENITWEKIDYYINIDFNWFKEIIDSLWWIEITLEENFIDEQYPDDNWWYRTLFFRKGTWLFDWESTLKLVRSRHSTSDFDRSLRQQKVIEAIKDRLISLEILSSPKKIKELYNVVNKNIDTDISISKILEFSYEFWLADSYTFYSSNMNDSCFYWSDTCSKWWILYLPLRENFDWMSVLLVDWTEQWNLSDYDISKLYSNIVLNKTDIFKENYKINIFNSTKVSNLAWWLSNDIIRYWFNIPEYNSIWNTQNEYENSIIYYNNIDKDSETLKLLKLFFDWNFKETESPLYSTDWANIEIIIGKDYLYKENIFKF